MPSLDQIVFDHEHLDELLGNSKQANYIKGYLRHKKIASCILEGLYIDKDFMIDYQKFYSRALKKHEKFVKRIHFFSIPFTADTFKEYLEKHSKEKTDELQKAYLGFVIVKKIQDRLGHPIIGRTLLTTYSETIDGKTRTYLNGTYKVSLFGIELTVNSIPYQAQDQGVSACATVALWTVLNSVSSLFSIIPRSPAEVTEISTNYPNRGRIYPQSGLNLEQMILCLRSFSLDTEVLKIVNQANDDVIRTAVKAYLKCGIPVLAILRLKKRNEPARPPDFHAVVVTGYQHDVNDTISELYVHDDQIGPYSRVKPLPDFRTWDNEWRAWGFDVSVEYFIIPVYPKIRQDFIRIYNVRRRTNAHFSDLEGVESNKLDVTMFLTTVQKYKTYLRKNDIDDKTNRLLYTLSRFIWIIRIKYSEQRLYDVVFDGTAINPRILMRVKYSI